MAFEERPMAVAFEMLSEILRKNGKYALDITTQSWYLKPELESEVMDAFRFILSNLGLLCVKGTKLYI